MNWISFTSKYSTEGDVEEGGEYSWLNQISASCTKSEDWEATNGQRGSYVLFSLIKWSPEADLAVTKKNEMSNLSFNLWCFFIYCVQHEADQ